MYKVMIVDDESMVRIGVKSCIDWESNSFMVVGEASNGREALDLFEKLKPEIILTDIKMPVLDGLQLIKKVMNQAPDTKIIVLSCLNEYDYVREAMKDGAVDYLFKPTMSPEDILNILNDVKEKIALEESKNIEYNRLKDEAQRSQKIMREKYLMSLINTEVRQDHNIEADLEKYNTKLSDKKIICMMIEIDEHETLKNKYPYDALQLQYTSIINAINDVINQYNNGAAIMLETKEVVVLYNIHTYSQMNMDTEILNFAKKIKNTIKNYVGISTTIGISKLFNHFCNCKQAVKQAEKAKSQKFILGRGQIIKYGDIHDDHSDLKELFSIEIKKVYELAKSKKYEETLKQLEGLFCKMKEERNLAREAINELAIEIIVEFLRIFRDEISLDKKLVDKYSNIFEKKLKTFDEVFDALKMIIQEIFERIQEKEAAQYSHTINKAINYISENYAQDITLDSISSYVHISKNYFSKLFKEETGINFVQYLADVRVKHAVELLKNENIKTYEAAKLVGYDNYRYFCKIFKNITGRTPSEVK
ncbi:response regulator [Petroclostridium sp. X23]|uniref:response regulator transcription factor n=1 Tax=Petroclostridium sp. X23 TaxID=3045146 RepID=UPI0024AE1174|nr:response regulator [Petroclostridium sp. X23]WHH60942.1 response regulator [Petroclostridium sp. X23]